MDVSRSQRFVKLLVFFEYCISLQIYILVLGLDDVLNDISDLEVLSIRDVGFLESD